MHHNAERMSRVDTAWLRMDNDVNLMMIVGVWLLTPAITLEALRERIADKLLKYERFRQNAVADTMSAHWIEDPDFDIAFGGLLVERVDLQQGHVVRPLRQVLAVGDGLFELLVQSAHGRGFRCG